MPITCELSGVTTRYLEFYPSFAPQTTTIFFPPHRLFCFFFFFCLFWSKRKPSLLWRRQTVTQTASWAEYCTELHSKKWSYLSLCTSRVEGNTGTSLCSFLKKADFFFFVVKKRCAFFHDSVTKMMYFLVLFFLFCCLNHGEWFGLWWNSDVFEVNTSGFFCL